MTEPGEEIVTPTEVLDTLHKFAIGFKHVRAQIEQMDDEQLVEMYDRAKDLANISWLIRCLVLGIARDKTPRGDKGEVLTQLAKLFGIGLRMAELDVQVYDTFIKDNPDFEPLLPAQFYQIAASAPDPETALSSAIQMRAESPRLPASAFKAFLKGEMPRAKAPAGAYLLVPLDVPLEIIKEEKRVDDEGTIPLFGRVRLVSMGGDIYIEIK